MSQKSLGPGGKGRPVRVAERRVARMRSDQGERETRDQTEKSEEEKRESARDKRQSQKGCEGSRRQATGRGAGCSAGDRGQQVGPQLSNRREGQMGKRGGKGGRWSC